MYQCLQVKARNGIAQGNEQYNLESVKQFTVGRVHDNSLQILDNTISKHHAKIIGVKGNRHWIIDLQSANGIFVNGDKIEEKRLLEHGDSVQFGKYACLYEYMDKINSKNVERMEERVKSRGKSRGRINLKDYMFDEGKQKNQYSYSASNFKAQSQNIKQIEPESVANLYANDGQSSSVTQPMRRKQGKKHKPKQGKIKIPDIANYLKIEDDHLNKTNPTEGMKIYRHRNHESRLKLGGKESNELDNEEERKVELFEKEKNLFQQEQEAVREIERKRKQNEEKRLKMEVEQAKISQDLIQKQLILEEKVRKEQESLEKERERIQKELLAKEELKREEELKKIKQMERREKQMMMKLAEERDQQLEELKNKEETIRQQSENQYRSEYDKRKKELEIEAEALARQYENIYRETIKKVRTEIDNQETTLQKMEEKESLLSTENQKLETNIENIREAINRQKREFMVVSGRNKACILYASEIQDKIDGITDSTKDQQAGYYKSNPKKSAGNLKKLRESIANSRKLLKIKKREHENIYSQITALAGIIKEHSYPASTDVGDYLDTIIGNAQSIQSLKEEYLELVEAEKAVQDEWEVQLQENEELGSNNRLLQSQIKKNMREIDENTRDQIKKSTEQRLHMLKLMHFSQEEKKDAAKFLIQEMLGIEQETHQFTIQNEVYHSKIGDIITESEKRKRENEYLSEILFAQDANAHHFDNMKQVINNLLLKIEEEKEVNSPLSSLQATRDGMKMQETIQFEMQRKKQIKENMRKISQMGISASKNKANDKNPLIYFGDLLTKRQLELENRKGTIVALEVKDPLFQKEVSNVKEELKLLDQRKRKISDTLQKFKTEQLMEAKKFLLK